MSGIRSTMYEEIITDSVDKGFDGFFYFFSMPLLYVGL